MLTVAILLRGGVELHPAWAVVYAWSPVGAVASQLLVGVLLCLGADQLRARGWPGTLGIVIGSWAPVFWNIVVLVVG